MTAQRVTVEIQEQIAFVRLSRADKHNAIDMEMFHALDKVSKNLAKDLTIRAVIVSGDGEDFCSGLDVKSVMKNKANIASLLFKLWPGSSNLAQRVSSNWRKIPVPVIFAIHGRCWGGGMQIALGGDFRIVDKNASLSIMEARWGLIPDMGGNIALRELMPIDMAKELAMTGKVINAEQAKQYGLVTHISDDVPEKALELAKEICARSPDSVAAVKKLYNQNWTLASWKMLAKESYYQLKIILGKNQKVAITKQLAPEKNKQYQARAKW
ncbi:enoyl-CoA hydratase [Thalassotalea sp. 42_200_T64]|nr:enoyl-CoA hydratase [Thalassotalea sp. 42_200_T64]